MTEKEKKEQEKIKKDRYRFSADHWEDNGKELWVVPINSDYTRPQPVWWGKKATSTQPL